jgi:hypothetical protein
MISLVVLLCHQLAGVPEPVCVEEVIPQTIKREAGLIASPLPMAELEMHDCQVTALPVIAQWLAESIAYRDWTVKEWQCARDYAPKGRA